MIACVRAVAPLETRPEAANPPRAVLSGARRRRACPFTWLPPRLARPYQSVPPAGRAGLVAAGFPGRSRARTAGGSAFNPPRRA